MKRVLVIVNKWWECDPVMGVLLHDNARPKDILKWPQTLNHPRPRPATPTVNKSPQPRAIFTFTNSSVEIWCISDLLEDLAEKFQSSSERKMERLPQIFAGATPDLVIAVGTAGLPAAVTENGCVVVGTSIFIHDCHPNGENPDSKWNSGPFDQLLTSPLDPGRFTAFTKFDNTVADRLMIAPLNPSWKTRIIAQQDSVALGAVNVTNYAEYERTDRETLAVFGKLVSAAKPMSLETTHGLIRAQSNAPFLFVSGVTDRVGCFHDEVDPRPYAQNTVAAHNAGVVVAWMLPNINNSL